MLRKLYNIIEQKNDLIETWFNDKFKDHPAFIYNSVDLRNSGAKISAVDTNIFPAGFNNLSIEARKKATLALEEYFHKNTEKILLVTEFHTRNIKYLENVIALKEIIEATSREVFLASIHPEFTQPLELQDSLGKTLKIYPIKRNNEKILLENGFIPDLIIINNDFTSGSPEILQNITQEITPPTGMGWYRRTKYEHFRTYNKIATEFAQEFNFDPFYITTELGFCKKVNFKERKGLECIALETEKTLTRIKDKYQKYGIEQKPYVYIKANQGTYGMGIMVAENAEEIFELNKKTRNKMQSLKSNRLNTQILIQEGIETADNFNNMPCEPFIYLINGVAVGSIIRVNSNKNSKNNLNSTGAQFFAADKLEYFSDQSSLHIVIARLAALAARLEEYQNE